MTEIPTIIVLLLVTSFSAQGTPFAGSNSEAADPANIRQPSPDRMESYRADPAFYYRTEAQNPVSLRERVYHWIQERLSPVFESRATYHLFQILPYAIIATAFILIVLKILGVNGRSVFYGSGSDRRSGLHADPVDVDAINFDYEIDQALLRGRYREAVRYTYLQLLKNLSDNDFISWKPDKTNGEYARELSGSALREPFEEVTRVFELVWYGEFPADESVFTAVRSTIADLTQNLVQEP